MYKATFRKTKIVCTLGPATNSPDRIAELIHAGMDIARLNFSHGDHETHRQTIKLIRSLSRRVGKEIGILQDLGGPKIRLGNIKDGRLMLHHGQRVVLIAGEDSEDESIPVNYPEFARDTEIGNIILLADGTVQLEVVEKAGERIICKVIVGGVVSSHKGVNFPNSRLSVKALTDKDRMDLMVGLGEKVDFVALSFVRGIEDLEEVRGIIEKIDYPPCS